MEMKLLRSLYAGVSLIIRTSLFSATVAGEGLDAKHEKGGYAFRIGIWNLIL